MSTIEKIADEIRETYRDSVYDVTVDKQNNTITVWVRKFEGASSFTGLGSKWGFLYEKNFRPEIDVSKI